MELVLPLLLKDSLINILVSEHVGQRGYLLHGKAEIQHFSLFIENYFMCEHSELVKYF